METVFNNINSLWPYFAGSWLIVIVFTIWKPQKYFNSVLLMIALMFTLMFVAGLFGDNMSTAMIICIIAIMAAIFMVPVMLIVNGIVLIKKESLSAPHILSLVLGILVGAGEIATVILVLGTISTIESDGLKLFIIWVAMSVFYFSCLVLNFVTYSVFIQILPRVMKFDYVIIHGCGLIDGERMTKLLSNRVDKAIEIYNRCEVKPIIIPSGGRGDDEKISEAEAMRQYLLEHGIPEEHIIMEDESATTMENLRNSKNIIESRPGEKHTALVSSNYHIYRCLSYAKKVGLDCVGIGAKVALYFWPSALIREFIAVFLTRKFFIWSILGYLVFISPVILVLLGGL